MSFADPLELFRVALARLNDGDFLGAARCCDPVSLRAFKRQTLERYESLVAPRVMPPEFYMRSDPNMPREVAEYQSQHHARHAAEWSDVSRELPGIATLNALREADAEAVFAHFLQGKSISNIITRMIAAGELSVSDAASTQLLNAHRHTFAPLAFVELSPTIGHILFRHDSVQADGMPDPDSARYAAEEQERISRLPEDEQLLHAERRRDYAPSIASCRRQLEGGWLLLAEHDFLGTGTGFVIGRSLDDDDDE